MIETDVMQSIRKNHHKMRDLMTQNISETDLSFRLFHILVNIRETPDINQKDLATHMKLTQGAISGSIKKLLELGMLEQIRLEEDNRYNQLVVTHKGNQVIIDYEKYLDERLEYIFEGFSRNEKEELNRLLRKLNSNLDKIREHDKEGMIK